MTLWGSAFVAIRDAGRTLSPGSLALGRLLVSMVVLGAAAMIWREPLPERSDLLRIAAFGVLFLGVYSVTLNEAERRVDAGTAAMLINIGPILIAILAGIFLEEGFPRRLFAGSAVALSGCVLIGLASSQSGSRAGLGIALLIVAAFAYATAVVIQKPVLARVSPLQVTWLGCAAGTVVCLPFAPTLVGELDGAGATAFGGMVYLGIAPTAVGFAAWAYALRRTSAGRLASLAYLIPVVAILLGWVLLGETPPWLAAVGGALCLAASSWRGSGSRQPARSFGLSRQLWVVQVGIFLNMLATAPSCRSRSSTHDGRGFSLGVAGLVVGTITGLAVVAAPVAGAVIDRIGARATAAGGGLALAAATADWRSRTLPGKRSSPRSWRAPATAR